jgi:hypothetical protein
MLWTRLALILNVAGAFSLHALGQETYGQKVDRLAPLFTVIETVDGQIIQTALPVTKWSADELQQKLDTDPKNFEQLRIAPGKYEGRLAPYRGRMYLGFSKSSMLEHFLT